jgi:carboxypeptidase Taq
MTPTPAYSALTAHRRRIYNLEHLQAIASWDRLTNMPSGAAPARAMAQGELAALLQVMGSDPTLGALLDAAKGELLDPEATANLDLMRHERARTMAVPEALARQRVQAAGASMAAWEAAKAANSWAPFADALEPLVAVVRETARRIGDALAISPYDALLDGFDRGLRTQRVKALFGEVQSWLPDMIASATARPRSHSPTPLQGPFDPDVQRSLCAEVMAQLGFDFSGGRLDTSVHPFTGGTPEDVRLTTRYRVDEVLPALTGVIHETGHGRYQAGLPRAWLGQLLGEACSASMHEAQALAFERQMAPTRGFIAKLSPLMAKAFGPQDGFSPDNLRGLLTRVAPGAIRVEADELTYPAHVMLRVDIEMALIEGEIGVRDVPDLWDEKMSRLLGLNTRGDVVRGPLQDVHWAQGMFGYFPSYLLGAMIAAQLVEAYRQGCGDDDLDLEAEDLGGLPDWLAAEVWSRGASLTTEALVQTVTGAPLGAAALKAHLARRYSP